MLKIIETEKIGQILTQGTELSHKFSALKTQNYIRK